VKALGSQKLGYLIKVEWSLAAISILQEVRLMRPVSILNDVLGPVMRGPSSSHTAAPFFIGTITRALLGKSPHP